MADGDDEQVDRPATWENVVVGEVKEVVGHVTGDKSLIEEGEEQVEIAHQVHDERHE